MPYTVYMREGTTATSPQRTQVEPVSLRAPQASSGLHTTSPVPAREIGTSGSDHTLSPAGPGPSRTKRQRLSALQRAPRPLPENAREPPNQRTNPCDTSSPGTKGLKQAGNRSAVPMRRQTLSVWQRYGHGSTLTGSTASQR